MICEDLLMVVRSFENYSVSRFCRSGAQCHHDAVKDHAIRSLKMQTLVIGYRRWGQAYRWSQILEEVERLTRHLEEICSL
jgi:hypothetical protein